MASRSLVIGLFHTTIAVAVSANVANAQGGPQEVRFLAQGMSGGHWQGYLERLTRDSLYLRVRGTDTVAAFSRLALDSVERLRLVKVPRAVGIGCLAVGGPLGALGYFGTHDPDSPGIEKMVGAVGFVVGCGLGAIGGAIVAAVHGPRWEPWTLPEDLPPSAALPAQSRPAERGQLGFRQLDDRHSPA
jgi:hypothetical protein